MSTQRATRRTMTHGLLALCPLWLAAGAAAQLINKPRVPSGRDPGGVAVAVVDSGVNYMLSEIATRLAREGEGDMIGLDLEDGSLVPFDRVVGEAGVEAAARGTTLASIVLAEAPGTRLVTVRTKSGDPASLARAIAFIARGPARIVAIGTPGSARALDWEPFRQAAAHVPGLLFIITAGSDDRDLDAEPRYPAAFALANVLVVAASDATGRLLPRQSTGARAIDVAMPAVDVVGLGFEGRRIAISGERAALARATALAARLSRADAALAGAKLKEKLLTLATPITSDGPQPTRAGYIADAARAGR